MRGKTDQAHARIAQLAGGQHGVVARRQLRRLGLSDQQIDRMIASGWLIPIHRGVYAVGHSALSREGTWMAAALAGGPQAALSHQSGAELWRLLPTDSRLVHVTVSVRSGRASRRGTLVVHRSLLWPADRTRKQQIPVTRPERTAIDMAEVLDRRPLERLLDEGERLRLWRGSSLRAALARHPGRVGAARIAAVLDDHTAGTTATVNDFEELFLAICDGHGIPRPDVNQRLGRYRPDFLWREAKLIVETDGRKTHGTRRAFEEDRKRDVTLTNAGYRVLRFTWHQLKRERDWVARMVIEALAR